MKEEEKAAKKVYGYVFLIITVTESIYKILIKLRKSKKDKNSYLKN